MRLGFLFLAIAVPGLVVTIVKRIVGRARPVVAGEDAFLYKFFLWRVEYASFPSGHATTAFAAAVAFGVLWPRLRPLLWTYAIVIALSRVIVTAHHPSDVVAGAIAGAVGALLVRDWMAARRLGFSIRTDGTVRPFAGPIMGADQKGCPQPRRSIRSSRQRFGESGAVRLAGAELETAHSHA